MLEVDQLDAFYGSAQVLRRVSFKVSPGEVLCLTGRNGAGKTTTLKALMGLVRLQTRAIRFEGTDLLDRPPHLIPSLGIGYVPQGRRLFSELTVAENLEIGLYARGGGGAARDRAVSMFPVLEDRLRQRAGTLSGGEQQMLAIARALCLLPSLLMLDEPMEGLQPSMVSRIREAIQALRVDGVGILLVEQRLDAIKAVADRVIVLEHGEARAELSRQAVLDDPDALAIHLGLGV